MKMYNQGDDKLTEEMLVQYAKTAKQFESVLTLARGVLAMLFLAIPTITISIVLWLFG